jgi:hypothetical protein
LSEDLFVTSIFKASSSVLVGTCARNNFAKADTLTTGDDAFLAAVDDVDVVLFLTEMLLDMLETDVTIVSLHEFARPPPGMDIRAGISNSDAS